MSLTIITSAKLTEIQNDVMSAIADVEAKHGLKISIGRGTYSDSHTGDFKLKLLSIDPSESDSDRLRKNLERAIERHHTSFKLDDIGTVFKRSPRGRNRYTFMGLDETFKPVAKEHGKDDLITFSPMLDRELMMKFKA
ncbi:hypothetical protein BM525_19585 (plasmid) [Alteromonas mediterranea]|uniref:Uncharacterized protein n=1 Tax=Alteromonas mediterranea TaxID=314275 RepID=A0AAC9NTV6_9ALTE|nr:hypothetical protein [Alteromonas mediterranea]APD92086.1 hypothetical protein BM524_19390 [Alteromonas mediterranea]APD99940.1 hypothetical protein BM525_19585 [Alteromonas mediterranea]